VHVVYKGNNRILRNKKLKFRIFFVNCWPFYKQTRWVRVRSVFKSEIFGLWLLWSPRTLTRTSEKLWKIGYGCSLYQLFSKRHFYFIKCGWNWQCKTWPKIEFFDFFESLIFWLFRFKNVSNVFHDLKNLRIAQRSLKICQFLTILSNFIHILWI
jgi:hypothetical protein